MTEDSVFKCGGFSVAVFRPEHSLDSWACELRKHGFAKRIPETFIAQRDAEAAGRLAAVMLEDEAEIKLEPLGEREKARIREADAHASGLAEGKKLENVSDVMWYKRYLSLLEAAWTSTMQEWEPCCWKGMQEGIEARKAAGADAPEGAGPAVEPEAAAPRPAISFRQGAGNAMPESGTRMLDPDETKALLRREKFLRYLAEREAEKEKEAGEKAATGEKKEGA